MDEEKTQGPMEKEDGSSDLMRTEKLEITSSVENETLFELRGQTSTKQRMLEQTELHGYGVRLKKFTLRTDVPRRITFSADK